MIRCNQTSSLRSNSQLSLSTINTGLQERLYDLETPSSCSSIHQIPHNQSVIRRNIHLIHPNKLGSSLLKHNSPTPSTKMISNPSTKNINGMRSTKMKSSKGRSKGVLDPGAMGKNGAIPVPGSRNFVNFSIRHTALVDVERIDKRLEDPIDT